MSIAAIGYLRIQATDPDAFMQFCTEVLGLMEAPRNDAADARERRGAGGAARRRPGVSH